MDELLHAAASGIRLAVFFGCTAGIFTCTVICVCRCLKWAPVNITVNINDHRDTVPPAERGGEA